MSGEANIMASERHAYVEPVKPEWIDVYGHLNEGYYCVAFANANWGFFDDFGIGAEYHRRTGAGFYTVESHIRYLRAVRAPAELRIETTVLEVDAKRFRNALVMTVDGTERATLEGLYVHIDGATGRSAPIPDDIRTRLERIRVAALPDWAGRGISLARR